jgi:hypothetical protein
MKYSTEVPTGLKVFFFKLIDFSPSIFPNFVLENMIHLTNNTNSTVNATMIY